MLKTSPSGSLCPYYYMGGELHPLKYGSHFDRKEELLAVMKVLHMDMGKAIRFYDDPEEAKKWLVEAI